MNSLQSNYNDFQEGLITNNGFSALQDAYVYGNVSSISCLINALKVIKFIIDSGKSISICADCIPNIIIKTEKEFLDWCELYFKGTDFEVLLPPNN